MPAVKSIPVLSSDQKELDLPRCVVEYSDLGIELDSTEDIGIERIPLKCTKQGLEKIIEVCKFYNNNPKPEKGDTEDAKALYQTKINAYLTQFHIDVKDYNWILILETDYLEIKFIYEILCSHVAETMRGKTTEELREMYDIENDFSPEDKEYVS
uniref:Skp1 domain-containing protein n=1 Tax=Rhabditophanes sp. KR3021 TaxID=114890 RepID=A0AC35U3R8_9BILA